MIVIKFIVLIRACGAIEPCLFVASFLITFDTAVSSFHPTKERKIFIHNMESISIIKGKDIWLIRRGGQITERVFKGNQDGSWEQIWGIVGTFMQDGSIIKGYGRYIQTWATKLIC